jgi:hypothetical protein
MKKISTAAVRSVAKATPIRRGYHDIIIDHYENPRNVGSLDKNKTNVGTGKCRGGNEAAVAFDQLVLTA